MRKEDRPVALQPGAEVWIEDRPHTLKEIVSLSEVVVEDSDGKPRNVKVTELKVKSARQARRFDLAKTPAKMQTALDWHRELLKLVQLPECTTKDVDAAAKELGVNRSTVYRRLTSFAIHKSVSGFLRKQRSDMGKSRLGDDLEGIVSKAIQDVYLTMERKTVRAVVDEIRTQCSKKGLKPPHVNTIEARCKAIPQATLDAKRYGPKYASQRHTPLMGSFPNAGYPMAVYQIDHTPMDVIVVDDQFRKPIGRPYLTLAIDVCTRMVVGFYISLEAAGALATGLCLAHAFLPKEEFLRSLGLDPTKLPWLCYGFCRVIHSDNAKEFRGTMLGLAVKEHGMFGERRPQGQPKFGGHIERSFRTFMTRVHELPGTTFSNVKQKVDYDSEGKAVMSLRGLITWFTVFIAGVYNQSPHKGLNEFPPAHIWQQGLLQGTDEHPPVGLPMPIEDPERLRLDFLPYFEGTVQEYGIQWHNIKWYDDALRRLFHVKDPTTGKSKKYIIRYDPRDLSRLWLYDDAHRIYIPVGYANMARPPVSLWEVGRALAKLKKDSKLATNEELLFHSIEVMSQIVVAESEATTAARRFQQRQKEWKATQATNKSKGVAPRPAQSDPPEADDNDFELPSGIVEL